MTKLRNVGLVGVGAMGEPMGGRLLSAGFRLHTCVHHRRERVMRLVAQGAVEVEDAAAVAARSEVVVTVVPDAPQVEDVLFGERGVAAGLTADGVVIDMSTISPVASRAIAERLKPLGIRMLDAPVSGGPSRAQSGDLTIMVGGERETFDRCLPLFEAMGTATLVGPAGMGETFKLANQIIIANVMLANVEALVFAKKSGADIQQLRDVLLTATGANYLLEKWIPTAWFDNAHKVGFAIDLLRKDLAAAIDAARQMGIPMMSSALAYQLYTAASGERHGTEDYSVVAQLYERAAGVCVVDGASSAGTADIGAHAKA
ncbi:MAG: NAD(P)-dependent oxidoreductase [Candidatus Eremiobacter antarcticus]|nr:NAD(P)-dependent oxidoreductase [Candidatus Eremiobacteraeota bacterium]MBC5807515.1 NAD(P)-dependent oxidoreductase [Candidatus Eremiobacteraeota bacterium]